MSPLPFYMATSRTDAVPFTVLSNVRAVDRYKTINNFSRR